MLSLTHASAGALAGEFIPNPFLAFLAGIAIHLIMDKIPHYWPEEKAQQKALIFADTLLPALFIAGLILFPATRQASVITGALGGVSVDLFAVIIMKEKGKFAEWHTKRQPHKKERVWILSDLLIFASLVALIIYFR